MLKVYGLSIDYLCRKESVAFVSMFAGSGKILINNKDFIGYLQYNPRCVYLN